MGEHAEMMLDGILDDMGEYTGHGYGYPRQHRKFNKKNNHLGGVRNYLRNSGPVKGQHISHKAIRDILLAYATLINHPPIGDHQTGEDWDRSISEVITKEWSKFLNWFKTYKS